MIMTHGYCECKCFQRCVTDAITVQHCMNFKVYSGKWPQGYELRPSGDVCTVASTLTANLMLTQR